MKGLRCICGGTLKSGVPLRGKGVCDLCEDEVLANDEGVRYCGRRHKLWGKAELVGARHVRCNVYVCKGCANYCPDGAVVAVRSQGPGDYSNDEVGSGTGEGSASPSKKESSSGDEEQATKEAEESYTDGEEDCRSPSKKGSSSDDEEESKEEAGEPRNGDGASLEEVERIVGQRRSKTDGDKNEFKIR